VLRLMLALVQPGAVVQVGRVNAVLPETGFHVWWDALWQERSPGISLNYFAFMGQGHLPHDMQLDVLGRQLNTSRVIQVWAQWAAALLRQARCCCLVHVHLRGVGGGAGYGGAGQQGPLPSTFARLQLQLQLPQPHLATLPPPPPSPTPSPLPPAGRHRGPDHSPVRSPQPEHSDRHCRQHPPDRQPAGAGIRLQVWLRLSLPAHFPKVGDHAPG
jgi:hypothetical protein